MITDSYKELVINVIQGDKKLILLKRVNPNEYEIHVGEIQQTKNLLLSTKDLVFAQQLVDNYNQRLYKHNATRKTTHRTN